jgi:hypothetical protein
MCQRLPGRMGRDWSSRCIVRLSQNTPWDALPSFAGSLLLQTPFQQEREQDAPLANLPGSAVTAAAVVIVLLAAGAGGMIGNQAPGTAGTWPLRRASLPGHRPPESRICCCSLHRCRFLKNLIIDLHIGTCLCSIVATTWAHWRRPHWRSRRRLRSQASAGDARQGSQHRAAQPAGIKV